MPVRKPLPVEDGELKSFDFQGQTFYVKPKFKVGRFLKTLNESPVDALEFVLAPSSFELFLELEISMAELEDFMNDLSTTLAGKDLKN